MKLNGPKQYLLRVAVLASLAALAFAVPKFSLRPAAEPLAAPTSVLTAARAAAPQNDKFVVERVTIFPYGFEPEEITRPVGPFLLAIDNRLGNEDLSFELVSEGNQRVSADSIRKGRARTQREISLPPGKYVLREQSHPEWTCTITIIPK
jgi:hypothetical protein